MGKKQQEMAQFHLKLKQSKVEQDQKVKQLNTRIKKKESKKDELVQGLEDYKIEK